MILAPCGSSLLPKFTAEAAGPQNRCSLPDSETLYGYTWREFAVTQRLQDPRDSQKELCDMATGFTAFKLYKNLSTLSLR